VFFDVTFGLRFRERLRLGTNFAAMGIHMANVILKFDCIVNGYLHSLLTVLKPISLPTSCLTCTPSKYFENELNLKYIGMSLCDSDL